ncbi:sulfite exporter TauE/SafE family protein [Paenalkalicoccus suaedae]|uniref:Probable membrane transporter protein n=1 Tax=Paenalkalicoccus suaedae TaxID=2592382 RepID=A0A859FCS0_9BACI|nr:sulfite exporter TauE/SafE family protein [Paenalkalicoccus suaedae]QKS70374.1 sulfite exporter TauE/SafE family protein [Paenalkalicoccus suaedae]
MDLELGLFMIVVMCAILIGISKTALPTLGILVTAIMATVFPARESIALVLPMLILADIVAVTYYRSSVNWGTLLRLIPWVSGGLMLGFLFLFLIDLNRPLEIVLGCIILLMVTLQLYNQRTNKEPKASILLTAGLGTLAGFSTITGNAAGPVMAIFLLAAGLKKEQFIGTGAWFFLTVNVIKLPLFAYLGLFSTQALTMSVWLIPAVLLGSIIGILALKRIPQASFNYLILALSVLGALGLLLNI